jgi:hypothetical protein
MRARHRGREGTLKRSTCRASLSPLRREVARRLEAGRRCGVKPGQHILSTRAELTLLCGRNCQALLSVFLSFFISIISLIVLNILHSAHTNNIHPRAGFSLPVPLSHAGPVPLLGRLLTDS